jgi:hypothetical protein
MGAPPTPPDPGPARPADRRCENSAARGRGACSSARSRNCAGKRKRPGRRRRVALLARDRQHLHHAAHPGVHRQTLELKGRGGTRQGEEVHLVFGWHPEGALPPATHQQLEDLANGGSSDAVSDRHLMVRRNPVAGGVSTRADLACQQIDQLALERQGGAVFNVKSNAPMVMKAISRLKLVKLSIQFWRWVQTFFRTSGSTFGIH